jgi:hypothetical protein
MNPTVKALSVGFIYPLGKLFFSWLPAGLQFSTCLKIWRSLLEMKSLQKKQKLSPTEMAYGRRLRP